MFAGLGYIVDATPTHIVSADVKNLDLGSTMFGAGGHPTPVVARCVVRPGATVSSTSLGPGTAYPDRQGPAALNLNNFVTGSLVILVVQGRIQGCGGAGGEGPTISGVTYAGGSGGAGDDLGPGADNNGIDATTEVAGGRSPAGGANLGNPDAARSLGVKGGHAVEGVSSCELVVYNEGEIWGGGGGGTGCAPDTPTAVQIGGAGGGPGEGGEASAFTGTRDPDGDGYAIRVEAGGPNGSGQGGILAGGTGSTLTRVTWP